MVWKKEIKILEEIEQVLHPIRDLTTLERPPIKVVEEESKEHFLFEDECIEHEGKVDT
jgi:hypothetical protein